MMDLNVTDEELEALKYYKEDGYKAINQMLVSNSEADIALLSDEVENEVVSLKYDRESIIEYINAAKLLYSLILKKYYQNTKIYNTTFYRGTNLAEIEMLKISPYIDKFLVATLDKDDAETEYASNWNRPASMNLIVLGNLPYIQVSDLLEEEKYAKDILILPFTKVKSIEELSERELDKNAKTVKVYNVELEKQELDELSREERDGLYRYILDNSVFIRRKLEECINLEKENVSNFENIRKLEQLLNKYENNDEDDFNENIISEREDDIERITNELESLKRASTDLFEIRKENINFINMWKRNIAVYMMAECKEIENEFEKAIENSANSEEEAKPQEIDENLEEPKEETVKSVPDETIVVPVVEEFEKEEKKDEKENSSELTEDEEEVAFSTAMASCEENLNSAEKMLEDINNLITKQQNHAKIAGNMGASYSALNNAFDMRKATESLIEGLKEIKQKTEDLKESKEENLAERFKSIAKNNIEINTLLNYINNPKIATMNGKASRFDEMEIIEENELKRVISEKIREIRGEAELRKLKDDLEIINDKTTFEKVLGFFTGRNKLDEFMLDQIDIRQKAIRKTLSNKMSLAYNYSVHEMVADISMFIEDNTDDELVESEVNDLRLMSDELRKNFVVSDFKVKSILDQKEHKNLPVEKKKMSKRDIIEVETYRFLNKYGYDINNNSKEEPKYQDTMAHEIGRVVEYINSSKD